MTNPSKSGRLAAAAVAQMPARWEERSTSRALDIGRGPIPERSRKIVEAALDVLGQEGLDGLTIRAVLKKSGLSRRAFYERFAGKDDLVLAVFEETLRLAASHFGEQAKSLSSPMERLKLIIDSIVLGQGSFDGADGGEQGSRRVAALSREHLRLAESRPHDLQAALSPLITLIAQQLSDGMAAGLVRPCDPQRLASLVFNLTSTTVHTELLAQEAAQPDRSSRLRLASDIWEFCRRAVAA